jgi:hypothetical protein
MSLLSGYARKLGVMEYLGTWNASTNTPQLTSSAGQRGGYCIVSVAGTTNLNGITSWDVGDWAIFNGSVWQKIDTAESEGLDIEKLFLALFDSKEPTGHLDRTQSTLSFNESTRTLSIAPVSSSFTIYIRGVKIEISSTLQVQIPNTSGSYFFTINGNGQLNYQQTFDVSILTDVAYTSYVYWNADTQTATSFGEERHGISMDGTTHGYLHSTRGTQLVSGASIGFTATGNGTSNADAQISISDLQVRDEDIRADIRHAASPSAFFEQILSPIAQIPVYYRSGSYWVKSAATQYPLKQGTNRAQYNKNTAGVWSLQDASADGKFLVSYIFATTNVSGSVIALLGQDEYTSIEDAKARAAWSAVSFGDLPAQEMKLLHIVIYETSSAFSNTPKAAVRAVMDLRFGADREVSATSFNTAHSNLSGLGLDDHIQYHNDTRGDARYYTKTQVDSQITSAKDRNNHTGTQLAATISDFTSAVQAVTIDAAKIDGGVVSNAEFATLDGITTGVTIQSQLNGKESSITAGTTSQYWRGDKSFQTLNAAVVANTPSGNIAATNVQTALNELDTEKQAVITGAATTITSSDLTASRALASDASGKVAVSVVTSTELSYVSGVTSAIQTQIDGKRGFLGIQTLTTGTTYTPTAGTTYIEAILVGAGGGGGGVSGATNQIGVGGGGGGGAILIVSTALTGAASYTYAIGTAGTAGTGATTPTAGGAGGSTTLTIGATTYTAAGGSGGAAHTAGTAFGLTLGGAGGTLPTGGSVNVPGISGSNGFRSSGTVGFAGAGASSQYGAGGASPTAAAAGNSGTGYGAGGSGGFSTANQNRAGGAGSAGVIIIREYK